MESSSQDKAREPVQVVKTPDAFFIDIETVPQYELIVQAPKWMQAKFIKRFEKEINEVDSIEPEPFRNQQVWKNKAALSAEFGKIVSISIGSIKMKNNEPVLYLKSIASRFEKTVLEAFCFVTQRATVLCAHNGKEFDFPFLFRRLLINKVKVPYVLNSIGKKPYEMQLEDTMEMYSGTQWKYKVGLETLAELFGIPSPKQDMTGAQVSEVFYGMMNNLEKDQLPFDKENEILNRIKNYNNGDVIVLAQIYCLLKQIDITITHENIIYT